MRTFILVVLFASMTAASALAQASAPPAGAASPTNGNTEVAALSSPGPPVAELQRRAIHRVAPLPEFAAATSDCYTMRSYLMRRESKNTDVTRQRGYTTCTPASRIHFKAVPAVPKP